MKDNIPLNLPELKSYMKFLEVMLDENISWRIHIRMIEYKMSKNIKLCHAKQLLDQTSLKTTDFLYTYIFILIYLYIME